MRLIDYLKEHSTVSFDRKELKEILKKAGKDLMINIQKQANGTKKQLAKVFPIIKEFFGDE